MVIFAQLNVNILCASAQANSIGQTYTAALHTVLEHLLQRELDRLTKLHTLQPWATYCAAGHYRQQGQSGSSPAVWAQPLQWPCICWLSPISMPPPQALMAQTPCLCRKPADPLESCWSPLDLQPRWALSLLSLHHWTCNQPPELLLLQSTAW